MSIMNILTAPDPILKQVAANIGIVNDNIRKLMDDMLDTMYHGQGIGLAAPQVGVSKRVIVLDLKDAKSQEEYTKLENPININYPLFMANPDITVISDEIDVAKEGCLSLPDQGVDVERYSTILVTYLDYNNRRQEIKVSGLLARAIQHEVDHLNGILLIDYLSPIRKDIALRKLSKVKRLYTA